MSLYNLIKSLDLNENLSKPELYSNIKLVSDYVAPNLSTLAKPELILLIQGFKKYLENYNSISNPEYKFDSQIIKLDSEQLQIVQSDPDLNMRVVAGAGSGKTTTILCRVKYILDNFTLPDRILILTFNRDSAQNIRNRISSLFGFPIHLNIYTIDAFCYKLMNYYNYDSDIKIYSVSEYSNTGLKLMEKFGKEISSQYKYIFFDEFQDVNDVQFNILKIFVDNGCVLTVIGDDCQNIYQFRGTNNYYMINFDRIIDSCTFKLTTNYRSIASIVEIANRSIQHNELKIEKKMVSFNNVKTKPKFVMCEHETDSIHYICKKILEAINLGIKLDRIAILARNSYPLKLMETELTKRQIEHVACITDKNNEDIKKMLVPDKIAVTTIHKSKGLEWDIVFIFGLSHEHWPEHLNNNIKNIEEERRLFYVGVTRSKALLYLVTNQKEIPISIFVSEVFDLLSYVRYRNAQKNLENNLFGYDDTQTIVKESYGVTELIGMLSPEDLEYLRKNNLILNTEPEQKNILNTTIKINFIEQIKKSSYEPDVGEFCDRYITRGIITKLKVDFEDIDTEYILNSKELTETQMSEYLKNNRKIKYNENVRRKFTYPTNILESIDKSYTKTKDISIENDKLLSDIYWISLCRNFRNDRNRLAYKNIFPLIKQNLLIDFDNINLLKRMDSIIEYLSNNQSKCKINVQHKFMSNNNPCSICGELDLIDIKNKNLIDLKCSENDFILEWMIQLLLYYSLMNKKDKKLIEKISVINVFNGIMYSFDIPQNYQSEKLIKYLENKISLDQLSERSKPTIYLESIDKNTILKKKPYDVIFNVENKLENNYIMILDTETSDFNGDILQISWIIIDEKSNYNIVEKHNYYVANRLSSKDSYNIHKISIDKLRKEGKDFYFVVDEFIKGLGKINTVVGHNVGYDLRCILRNFRKYDVIINNSNNKNQIHDIFEYFDIICTKKLSNGKSLEKLYHELYKENMIDAHDSLVDVMYTYKCFIKIMEQIKINKV
jgi:hypothetical protein